MSGSDTLQRWIFEQAGVRAVHVRLDRVYAEVLARGDYSSDVGRLLGEGLVVAGMLSSGVKFSGRISLQLRSENGPLRMLLADCDDQGGMRALASVAECGGPESEDAPDLQALAPDGILTLNLEPRVEGGRRWQGIVSMDQPTLAGAVEGYFLQSEQLPTRLRLASDAGQAAGLLLQKLPGTAPDPDGWNRLSHLLDTISRSELLELDGSTLAHRLFHEEDRREFPARGLEFFCPCSRERVSAVLRSLGREELDSILAEQGRIETACEFCNETYVFDSLDVAQLLASEDVPAGERGNRIH